MKNSVPVMGGKMAHGVAEDNIRNTVAFIT